MNSYCPYCHHCRVQEINTCSECKTNQDIIQKWELPVQTMAAYLGWKDKEDALRRFTSYCRHQNEQYLEHKAKGSCGHKGWSSCHAGEKSLREGTVFTWNNSIED